MLDFELTAPYTPATLSNIEAFIFRRDVFQKPDDNATDPTPVVLGLFRENIIVSFFYLHTLLSSNTNNYLCILQPNVNQNVYRLPEMLQPFTVESRFYRTSVSISDMADRLQSFPSYFQVEVLWKEGNGLPALSTNCRVDGVDAPPPLPISVVNIVNIDTGRVTLALSGDFKDVEAIVT